MSRSRHNKSVSCDLWSRRPCGSGFGGHGKHGGRWIKTRTHRIERRIADREIRRQLEQGE